MKLLGYIILAALLFLLGLGLAVIIQVGTAMAQVYPQYTPEEERSGKAAADRQDRQLEYYERTIQEMERMERWREQPERGPERGWFREREWGSDDER